jgi:hypothetical protein
VLIPLKEIEKTINKVINKGAVEEINLDSKVRNSKPEGLYKKRVIRKVLKSEMDMTIIG